MDSDLNLRESAALVEGVSDDGTVTLHLIRPCVGRGRGSHLYEADMLAENAHKFVGWKMYVDHQSPEARRAAAGLPRSIRDLGGRVLEAHWDPTVPAEGRFGQGAVVGKVRPTPLVRELIHSDPELVEASINSQATGVKPIMKDGKRVLLVEGIQPRGSVDWVTEAGAGGKVVSLMEAAVGEDDVLEALDDDDLVSYIEETRPGLTVTVTEASDGKDAEGDGDDDDAEFKAIVAKLVKKGIPQKGAEKIARKQMAGSVKESAESTEDDNMEITGAALAEALKSPEAAAAIEEIVEAKVTQRLDDERDMIRAEARADADRQIQLRDMRDAAHEKIRESKVPDVLKSGLLAQFDLIEGEPTDALDVTDEYADGKRVKSAHDLLTESVDQAISKAQEIAGALNPTRVEGMSASGKSEGTGTSTEGGATGAPIGDLTEALLTSAGFDKPEEVYANA